MASNNNQTSLILSVIITLAILVWGLPALINESEPVATPEPPPPPQTPEPTTQPADSEFSALEFNQPVRIKASGEEPTQQSSEIESYFNVRREFTKRFGLDFDEAWEDQQPHHHEFYVPAPLKQRVDFWINLFGRYGKNEYVFYHKNNVNIVYRALNLSDLNPEASGLSSSESRKLIRQHIAQEKKAIAKKLKKLMRRKASFQSLDNDERRLLGLFESTGESLKKATQFKNIAVHEGFKHRFEEALQISGRYMQEIENIFALKGLPVELTRIPFIESAFNIYAVSSANAVGLWQFIKETGKNYLTIDDIIDERRDPILATYAAAEHLEKEYELLGSWPLAINAYNTGPGRMLKAMKKLGTDDIAVIINNFESPGYKFYSRNYYPEFLAALHVYDHQQYFFGDVVKDDPFTYDLYTPTKPINLKRLFEVVDVEPQDMARLNPGLKPKVLKGETLVPPGTLVKVPSRQGRLFAEAAVDLLQQMKTDQWHLVQRGESLKDIANQYGVSLQVLADSNHLVPFQPVRAGSMVKIPQNTGVALRGEVE